MKFKTALASTPIRSQNKHTNAIGNTFLHYQRRIYEMSVKILERKSESIEKCAGWLTNNQLNPWIFVLLQKPALAHPLNKYYNLQHPVETQGLLQWSQEPATGPYPEPD
jgi:hypothetical protein